jgi:hypothetical protein
MSDNNATDTELISGTTAGIEEKKNDGILESETTSTENSTISTQTTDASGTIDIIVGNNNNENNNDAVVKNDEDNLQQQQQRQQYYYCDESKCFSSVITGPKFSCYTKGTEIDPFVCADGFKGWPISQ